jgi:hypothetical protein
MWNDSEVYNISINSAGINITDSIKNLIPINTSVTYGYNFSDVLGNVGSCYNTDQSIERPVSLGFVIGSCPTSGVSVTIIAICVFIALFFIALGYIMKNLYLPIFGWILMIISNYYLIGCIGLYAGIMILISILFILLTAISVRHNDY